MRANLRQTPAWSQAPPPTDEFLLMFLRTEVFSPSAAADRYRKFWEVFLYSVVFRVPSLAFFVVWFAKPFQLKYVCLRGTTCVFLRLFRALFC